MVNVITRHIEPLLVPGVQPISFDRGTSSGSLTFNHTCGGSDRYLIVAIAVATGTNTFSGVTYNGVAMTQLQRTVGTFSEELWGLVNPASGTNSVVITRGVGSGGVGTGAASFTNVDQTTPFKAGSATGLSSSSGSLSAGPSQTTNPGGMIVEGYAANNLTVTAPTQTGWNDGTGDGEFYLAGTGSAQQTSFSITGAGAYALASAVINAKGQAGVPYTDTDTVALSLTPSGSETQQSAGVFRERKPVLVIPNW